MLDGLRKTRSAYTRSRSGYREVTLGQRALQLASVVASGAHTVLNFTLSVPGRLRDFAALSGSERRQVYAGWWSAIKKEGRHYWVRSRAAQWLRRRRRRRLLFSKRICRKYPKVAGCSNQDGAAME